MKSRRILAAILTIILMTALSPTAQAEATDEKATPSGIPYSEIGSGIDAYIAEREAGMASCAVSVYDADGVICSGYYGYADIENSVLADADTVYDWGSASKLLVWVSVMQLWECGQIDFDKDIRDYLPEGFLTKLQYPKEKITMLNLMAHNAGFQESFYENQYAASDDLFDTLEEALRFCECYQAFHVGEYTAYSNYGTALAAYIVERVSGTDYVTYVHKNIFEPLGMEHTALDPRMADNEWVCAHRGKLHCYERYLDPRDNRDYGPCIAFLQLFPAGSAIGTLEDFSRFGRALVETNCPLFESNATRDEMFTPLSRYGGTEIARNCHGFWTGDYGVQTLGHPGNTLGCSANLVFDPASGLGIVIMTNEQGEASFNLGLPGLLFGDIASREGFKDTAIAEECDISGYWRMMRNIVCGAGLANSFSIGPVTPFGRNDDGTYSVKLFGISLNREVKLVPLNDNIFILRAGDATQVYYYGDGVLAVAETDFVRCNPFWTVIRYGFVLFGALCLLTVVIKLIVRAVRKKRVAGRNHSLADRQILGQQLVYGVSGVIFTAFYLTYKKIPAFTAVSAILAGALGLGALVNGALLCYNTIKSNVRLRTKLKQYSWAVLSIAYAAFILVMQLYNFWSL